MSNEQKIQAIVELIFDKTIPKDQLGLYAEEDLIRDVAEIIDA